MAVDDLAVAAGEHGNLETKLADRRAHAIDGVVVFAGIASIENQAVNGPDLNLHRRLRRGHHFHDAFLHR
jgi:hypothetical protein